MVCEFSTAQPAHDSTTSLAGPVAAVAVACLVLCCVQLPPPLLTGATSVTAGVQDLSLETSSIELEQQRGSGRIHFHACKFCRCNSLSFLWTWSSSIDRRACLLFALLVEVQSPAAFADAARHLYRWMAIVHANINQ